MQVINSKVRDGAEWAAWRHWSGLFPAHSSSSSSEKEEEEEAVEAPKASLLVPLAWLTAGTCSCVNLRGSSGGDSRLCVRVSRLFERLHWWLHVRQAPR